MDELEALAAELRRQLPAVPASVIDDQRRRFLRDPRARFRRPQLAPFWARSLLAGAAVLAVCVAWVALSPPASAPQAISIVNAERGEQQRALEDGSVIVLERGGRGRLDDTKETSVRFELERGRGRFSVAPRAGRVFSVQAGRFEVQVVGTQFTVGYEPAGAFSVAVEHGVVSVREPGRATVRLSAGDHLLATSDARNVTRARQPESDLPATLAPSPAVASVASTEPEGAAAPRPPAPASAQSWRTLYQQRDYAGALAVARSAGLVQLSEQLAAGELADLADAARLGGDLSSALLVLRALERRFPSSAPGRNAGFLIGRVLSQSGQTADAIRTFERYLAANPDGVYSLETMGRLMELYTPRGNQDRARAMAVRYLQRAPSGPYQRLARSLAISR